MLFPVNIYSHIYIYKSILFCSKKKLGKKENPTHEKHLMIDLYRTNTVQLYDTMILYSIKDMERKTKEQIYI